MSLDRAWAIATAWGSPWSQQASLLVQKTVDLSGDTILAYFLDFKLSFSTSNFSILLLPIPPIKKSHSIIVPDRVSIYIQHLTFGCGWGSVLCLCWNRNETSKPASIEHLALQHFLYCFFSFLDLNLSCYWLG